MRNEQKERWNEEHAARMEHAWKNNKMRLEGLLPGKRMRLSVFLNPKLRSLIKDYKKEADLSKKQRLCAQVLDLYEQSIVFRMLLRIGCRWEDKEAVRQRKGKNKRIDHSDKNKQDYYSVAVIIKNEARYIREFLLFYQATGADRIYLYDNESTDDLLEQLDPFLQSGFVIYTYWPGRIVQTAAYRDAVRRSRRRTKWLAIIDADEFLFSPKGSMPELLRSYEPYPGVGVNWRMFGPNGHDRRPKGLVMDNYTTTLADPDAFINCHIKSIVQPAMVLTVDHTHYAYYKEGFAVNECRETINNRYAYAPSAGRAFTAHNHTEIFRINHYNTKSLEDLEAKCKRGFSDGAPNTVFEEALRPFREPMAEDDTILPYADIVREQIQKMERNEK